MRRDVWHLLRRNLRVWLGGGIVLGFLLAAIAAPLIAPHDPLDQDLMSASLPPAFLAGGSLDYPLGTDSLGRDVFSRLIYGARVALTVAFVAAICAAVLGTVLGLLAGYLGGWVDQLISRLVDIWMAFPPVLLAIVLVAVFGAGVFSVILAIVVVDWTRFCRVVRAEAMLQASQDYVASALTIGMASTRILWQEILPNIVPLLIVLVTLEMGIAVIVEAILSFIGLSVGSDSPTWGGMIQEGRIYIHQAWWLMAAPMLCVILLVLGFNWLGDGLRNSTDPLLRR